jgi:hypothetical protein
MAPELFWGKPASIRSDINTGWQRDLIASLYKVVTTMAKIGATTAGLEHKKLFKKRSI